MLGAAVAAKIKIPPIILLIETELLHALLKKIKALFTLAAAYYFADAGNQ